MSKVGLEPTVQAASGGIEPDQPRPSQGRALSQIEL